MPAYKMKQQKALHKGWHISYGVADGEVWTTNSYLAVRKKVTPEECKALKEQHDKRGEQALDLQPLFDAYETNVNWPVHVRDASSLEYRNKSMQIDPDLFEYVEALWPKGSWFVCQGSERDYAEYKLTDNDTRVAMLAPIVKEE